MKLSRDYNDLDEFVYENMVLLIYGPRKAGKTSILNEYLNGLDCRFKLESGDNINVHEILGSKNKRRILSFAEGYELIVIDEAQKISNIGLALKILADNVPGIKIIAAGSSLFEAAGRIQEPLIGRKNTLTLFPMGIEELQSIWSNDELEQKLEDFLVFGLYPEVLTASNKENKIKKLNEITPNYLQSDRISPKGWTRIKARIIDDKDSPFIPSLYEIEPISVIKGSSSAIETTRIFSYMEEFRQQVRKDELVIIEGNLEKVCSNKRSFHQITLTYCPRYYEQVLKVNNPDL